jgi:hypothetical protein
MMIKEILPSLFLIHSDPAAAQKPHTYLLKRAEGNVLLMTKDDLHACAPQLKKLGGFTHALLGDRHHALPHCNKLADLFNAALTASDIEARALENSGVKVLHKLPYKRQFLAPDIEIIPTPGHTAGAFSFLWTNRNTKYLFVGDTLVPANGEWTYYVSAANKALFRRTLQTLSQIPFDVVLSNSFAAVPDAWFEMSERTRRQMFVQLQSTVSS